MSVDFVCPRCSTAHTAHAALSYCPACQQQLPDHVRLDVGAALAHQAVRKPLLLRLGRILALTQGASMLLAVILAPLGAFPYVLESRRVTGLEWLVVAGAPFAIMGAAALAIGEGLRRERPWTRPAIVLYWPLVALSNALMTVFGGRPLGAAAGVAVLLAVPAGAAAAYLYRKENVVAYYAALELQDSIDNPPD